jgi:MSHA biogenesis protein MshG
MPTFYYRACDRYGNVTEGKEKGETEAQVIRLIESRELRLIRIDRKIRNPIPSLEEAISQRLPVARQQLAFLFDQLGMMLSAGISIGESLQSVEEQASNLRLRKCIKQIGKRVQEGIPLHTAMMDHTDIFDETIIRVVEVGEHTGQLDVSLFRLAEMIEFDLSVQQRFKEATRYPKLVVVTLVLAGLLMINVVIPKFARLFTQSNMELPITTKILLGFYSVFNQNWPLLLFLCLMGYVALHFLQKNLLFAEQLESLRHKVPVLGELRLKIELNRIFRILSLLIDSGVDLLKSLKLVSQITQSPLLKRMLLTLRDELDGGESLPMALGKVTFIPRMAKRMLSIGEKTGRLSDSLNKISEIYERETSITIRKMSSLLEPILIVFIGMIVIVFALGIFLPMWDLIKVVK